MRKREHGWRGERESRASRKPHPSPRTRGAVDGRSDREPAQAPGLGNPGGFGGRASARACSGGPPGGGGGRGDAEGSLVPVHGPCGRLSSSEAASAVYVPAALVQVAGGAPRGALERLRS